MGREISIEVRLKEISNDIRELEKERLSMKQTQKMFEKKIREFRKIKVFPDKELDKSYHEAVIAVLRSGTELSID